jgi:hypothetical protein
MKFTPGGQGEVKNGPRLFHNSACLEDGVAVDVALDVRRPDNDVHVLASRACSQQEKRESIL